MLSGLNTCFYADVMRGHLIGNINVIIDKGERGRM